jgi:ABC-type lipoprotein export system ATPase subunit
MDIQERLVVDNLFSIEHFDWEIKDFNILTGEMASGKSVCLKLLHFAEQIFHENIFFAPISKESFDKAHFYENLAKQFEQIFHSSDPSLDFCDTKISYSYRYSDSVFDLTACWNDDKKKLVWNSEYINKNLDKWRDFWGVNTPDAVKNARRQICEKIEHDFSSSLPIGAVFIPAARAIAAIADLSDIPDPFLEDFIEGNKPFVLNFGDAVSDKFVNKILHLKKITANKKDKNSERIIMAELPNGRKITSLELSSGQQELIYLLLIIRNLFQTQFVYGETMSIFIEEPSAHLFPQEQKESIEYIVKIFRELQDLHEETDENRVRFFISTHSPYVLNVINNMLKKGYLIEKIDACGDENKREKIKNKVEKLKFPHLTVDEISAHFMQKKVANMITTSENGAFLYEEMIEKITRSIEDDYKKVRDLLREMKE